MAMKKPVKKAAPKKAVPKSHEPNKFEQQRQKESYREAYSKGSAYQSMMAKGSPSAGTRFNRNPVRPYGPQVIISSRDEGYIRAREEMLAGKGRRRNEIGGNFGATKPRTPAAAAGKAAKQLGQRIKKAAPKKAVKKKVAVK